jgi:hypothetical protein
VDFEGRRFTVVEMSDHRISQVRVERLEDLENEAVNTGSSAQVPAGRRAPKSEG